MPLHTDHLGSTSLATDANGNEVARLWYYSYGDQRYAIGSLPTDRRYSGHRRVRGPGPESGCLDGPLKMDC